MRDLLNRAAFFVGTVVRMWVNLYKEFPERIIGEFKSIIDLSLVGGGS